MDQEQESSISSRLHVFGNMAEKKDRSKACICCVFSFHSITASTIIVGRMKEQKEKLHKRSFALAGCSQCYFLWSRRQSGERSDRFNLAGNVLEFRSAFSSLREEAAVLLVMIN